MSDKLSQSLGDIISAGRNKNKGRTNRPRRQNNGAKPAPATAPVGGVKKHVKNAKPAERAAAPTPQTRGESKITVSNLPLDVTEQQIKDYFNKTIGPIKKVLLTYGPNGQSRGIATVIFGQADLAAKAARDLDGVKVDRRPMKIEVLLSASQVPVSEPQKGLADRITGQKKPAAKAQPKPVTAPKPANAKTGPKARGKRERNTGRGKPKTAAELDAEMQDYFGGDQPPANTDASMGNGGAVQPAAAGGDTAMDDEIL